MANPVSEPTRLAIAGIELELYAARELAATWVSVASIQRALKPSPPWFGY